MTPNSVITHPKIKSMQICHVSLHKSPLMRTYYAQRGHPYFFKNTSERITNMATAKMKSATAEMLEKLYKSVKMGADTIVSLLPKIDAEDAKFKSDLTMQMSGYESFATRINSLLREDGEDGKEDSMMTKMSAKIGTTMNTLMDSSVSHIADMIIQGSTMGITDTIKIMREYENTTASEASLTLARDIVKFEEDNIERMKAYL